MTFVDLEPAARQMAELMSDIPDDSLDAPTPCRDYTLGDLLDHVDRLVLAFTAAAHKADSDAATHSSSGDGSLLRDGWRSRIPQNLTALTVAWRDPAARSGMTRAGGVDMPGEVAAVVALEEVVLHGWDVARASGQGFACDQTSLEAARSFIAQFAGPDQADLRGDAYGDPVAMPEDAPLLDRVVALSGRDPQWLPG